MDYAVTVDEVTIEETVTCCHKPDFNYLRNIDGLLKLGLVISTFILLILALTNLTNPWFAFMAWASGSAVTGNIFILIIYLTRSVRLLQIIAGWIKFELVYCCVCLLLFLVTAGAMTYQALSYYGTIGQSAAATSFAFIASVLYALDAWLKYRLLASGQAFSDNEVDL